MRPSLLLLDEPTANLDPAGAELIRDAVREAVRDRHITLVVVDHNEGFWADVVDREIVMGDEGSANARYARRSRELKKPVSPPHPTTLARATNLAVGYPRSPQAQNNLNFEIVAGRILTVTGPNGAGKSALALTLAGLISAHAGELRLDRQRVPVGLVFQTPEHQFIGLTVRGDVSAGMRGPRRDRDSLAQATLDEFHLAHLAEQNPFSLSGGEKRRLSIADIVATLPRDRPAILVLDEPTTGLDHASWIELVESLRAKASEGHAIVVITHDQQLVAAISDERLELSS
jgi:energy-coupling factor transport system ATP-binding protein